MDLEKNSLSLKSGDRVGNNVFQMQDFAFRKVLRLLDEVDKNLNNLEEHLAEEGVI